MRTGAIILKGPQDWQICQQRGGSADIALSGEWSLPEGKEFIAVYARVVREDAGDVVIPWVKGVCHHESKWDVTLRSVPAGGLYRIETVLSYHGMPYGTVEFGYRGDMRHHIGVGDLYMIAGQSNASGRGREPIYDPPEPGVHLLRNSGRWDMATHPLNDSTDTISEANREPMNPGHSPWLHFAKLLKRELGYPVGLLQSSLGGAPLSDWDPEEGALYKCMLDVIMGQCGAVRGILWFQGCTDALLGEESSDSYLSRFGRMVLRLRQDLGDGRLPFLTVQLNKYAQNHTPLMDICWGKVREAQRQAAHVIPGVYVVPSTDCMLADCVHIAPAGNIVIGERLARAALAGLYGRNSLWRAPEIARATSEGDRLTLAFDNVSLQLYANDLYPGELPFAVADECGRVGIAGYGLGAPNEIVLTLCRELRGNAVVHGAFEQNAGWFPPTDRGSFLPMLSFYGMNIEKKQPSDTVR